jgi:prevent-host-death family protein
MGRWALQDAKARFSELVRKAKTEGPQRITVHGREEVVVIAAAALHHGLTVVSRDTSEYEAANVAVLNPWTGKG